MTKEEALKLLRKILGPSRRVLEGEERSQVLVLLKFLDPVQLTNNQQSSTEVYQHAGHTYHLHYFYTAGDPVVEEVDDDEITDKY